VERKSASLGPSPKVAFVLAMFAPELAHGGIVDQNHLIEQY
jgi:hypothetical protein